MNQDFDLPSKAETQQAPTLVLTSRELQEREKGQSCRAPGWGSKPGPKAQRWAGPPNQQSQA